MAIVLSIYNTTNPNEFNEINTSFNAFPEYDPQYCGSCKCSPCTCKEQEFIPFYPQEEKVDMWYEEDEPEDDTLTDEYGNIIDPYEYHNNEPTMQKRLQTRPCQERPKRPARRPSQQQ